MASLAKVVLGWEEVDPDGSACHSCGDLCYLFMAQAYYQISGCKKEYVNAVLCNSCDEMMRDSDNAGEEWKG